MSQNNVFQNVRIEKIIPFQIEYEIKTDTVWFGDGNIEDCIRATELLKIEHIHLQTTTIDFLNDPRLRNVKGIAIQLEVQDLNPLFRFKNLTHLNLPDRVQFEFDFSNFKNLIFLGGHLPKKYVNFDQLAQLKYTYLFGYRKIDFNDFASFKQLEKLWMYSLDIESLKGLSDLSNLKQIELENCRKLRSLEGLSTKNVNLHRIYLANCKKLRNANALGRLPNLFELRLYKIPDLNNLNFLNELHDLKRLLLHPKDVVVQNKDYYPLIRKLKELEMLDSVKRWKPLKDCLNGKVAIESKERETKSELELIKENLGIMNWAEKAEQGLNQYSKRNCKKAESILLKLIGQLDQTNENDLVKKEGLIKLCVLELNKFNDSLDGSFIETEEREELCDLFDNIADAVGLNVQNYQDGIASKWREW